MGKYWKYALVAVLAFIIGSASVPKPATSSAQLSPPVSLGLRLWLTSDAGITIDSSGDVQTWADQSGNGNDFIQNAQGARPTLVTAAGPDGADVLHFDGLDDVLANPLQLVAGTSVTVFTVMAVREPGYPWSLGTPIDDRMFYEGHPGGGVTGPDFLDVAHDNHNDARAILPGINDNTYKILTMTGSGTIHDVRVFMNGAPANMSGTGSNGPLDFSPGNTLGFVHTTPNTFTEVDFAEFIVYDRELNEAERESVESYLANRYFPGLDFTPPYTSNHDPAKGATEVPIDTNIVVHVRDDDAGVDQSSIVLTVEGVDVTSSAVITGSPADYTVAYDPPVDFAKIQVVNVTVDASDSANPPNVMPTDSYSFTTIPVLLNRVQTLESQVADLIEQLGSVQKQVTNLQENLRNHTHSYLTGNTKRHNNTTASTGPAIFPGGTIAR